MAIGFLDTTVPIHALRGNSAALNRLASQPRLSITPIVWMEVMYGAAGKRGQARSRGLLDGFELVYLTEPDVDWAMEQLVKYRLSHGVAVMDCLIASVCYRLQIPLYTHNVKDMLPLLDPHLVVQPYIP